MDAAAQNVLVGCLATLLGAALTKYTDYRINERKLQQEKAYKDQDKLKEVYASFFGVLTRMMTTATKVRSPMNGADAKLVEEDRLIWGSEFAKILLYGSQDIVKLSGLWFSTYTDFLLYSGNDKAQRAEFVSLLGESAKEIRNRMVAHASGAYKPRPIPDRLAKPAAILERQENVTSGKPPSPPASPPVVNPQQDGAESSPPTEASEVSKQPDQAVAHESSTASVAP